MKTTKDLYRIALLTVDWNYELVEKTFHGLKRYTEDHSDVQICVFDCFGKDLGNDKDKSEYAIFSLPDLKQFDGVIVQSNQIVLRKARADVERIIALAGIPAVAIGCELKGCSLIYFDNAKAQYAMTEHIIREHGARRLTYLTGIMDNDCPEGRQRLDGFMAACRDNRIPEENSAEILVKVEPFADQDTHFSVKGVVKCGSFSSNEFAFNYVIKQFLISGWDYWEANTSGTAMNVKGVIVAKYPYSAENKNTGVFLQDLDGEHGYFAYRLKCDSQEAYDTDLAVGNVIVVNGKTSIYNAFREMGAGCTYTLVYGDDGKVQTSAVNKKNIDALFKAGTDFTAELDKAQGTVVTVTGARITKIEWNKNSTETFEALGDGRVYVTIEKYGASIRLFLATSCILVPGLLFFLRMKPVQRE